MGRNGHKAMQQGLVLVVDDEALIALDLAATVEDSGRQVLGPAFSLAKARALLDTAVPEMALLDINVGAEQVWPLARELAALGTNIAFISGDLSAGNLCEEFMAYPRLHKPALPTQVTATLQSLASATGDRAAAE